MSILQLIRERLDEGDDYIMGGDQGVKDDDLQAFDHKNTPRVETLQLSHNSITELGVFHFIKPLWTSLTWLDINENRIGPKGCKYLTRAEMRNLERVSIGENSFGSDGVAHLSKGRWKSLKNIAAMEIMMMERGMGDLVRADWPSLEEIHISSEGIKYEQAYVFLSAQSSPQRIGLYGSGEHESASNVRLGGLFEQRWEEVKLYIRFAE